MSSGTDIVTAQGELIELDADGHLRDARQWCREVGLALAESDGVQLSADHWWLIEFVRGYYQRYGMPPLMRVAVAAMRQAQADNSLSSRHLYRLFSDNPIRQACRYGGLPKPEWCI